MSDQTFINDRILSQLDTISKQLGAIENSSASASKLHAAPRARNRSVKTVDSNLNLTALSKIRMLIQTR